MIVAFKFSYISSFYVPFCLFVVVALFRLCLSTKNNDAMLCMDDERQALLQFKHALVDEADRLASWVGDEKSDCCKWAGILCDNVTGHVQKIHLPGKCYLDDYITTRKEYEEAMRQRLRGDISPSIVYLKQLVHLDLSCNDFGGIQIPKFMGSLENLRHLNLSCSKFGGTIPPQLGNLTELRFLCLGSFYADDTDEYESTRVGNIQWLSSLSLLCHLDMSGVDLIKATDWLQVINSLPLLVQIHFSKSRLSNIQPDVVSLNLTFLSTLDLSRNNFNKSPMPQWIFRITSLVLLDLSFCGLHDTIPGGPNSFYNLTSLKFLHISGNEFMSSSLVLKRLSTIGGNLISLDISSCGVSSLALDSLHNLTSLLSLSLSYNQLTNTIPNSLGNLCNMRHINMGLNDFSNVSLTSLLGSFFNCNSPSLEILSLVSSGISSPLPDQIGQLINLLHLQLPSNRIAGRIPDSIGRLPFLRTIDLGDNLISGPVPYSVGGLISLENLILAKNQLNGTLPESLGQLSKLTSLNLFENFLTGVLTESHFSKLIGLKVLYGTGNNLTLRPRNANWIPSFQLQYVSLNSWDLGPQFPLWLLSQKDLVYLEIRNTKISSTMPESFWRLFPNLMCLDMSQNQIQGRLFHIPATLLVVDLSANMFNGKLPKLVNGSELRILDLSYNSFIGSLDSLLCPYGETWLEALSLGNNHLSGVIPECWVNWPTLAFLNLESNTLCGGIPTTLGSLSLLHSLNMCNNKLSGRLPASLKNLTNLKMLQFATNQLVGTIPAWIGTELTSLRILDLRSNNFDGGITHELCYSTSIQILDFAHNNLSGNIPRCFNNFSVMSKKETTELFDFSEFGDTDVKSSASLMMKGQEHTYSTTLGLAMVFDLSSNSFSGSIPDELMALKALQSLNLSNNQLTGMIPKNIGDLKLLESFDASLNHLFGELPASLSGLSFLSSFNVSYNNFTGKIPSSTQLQSLNESSFFNNKLCGLPLTKLCGEVVHKGDQQEGAKSHGVDFGLIISSLLGFFVGFWAIVVPLNVGTVRNWQSKLKNMVGCLS
ncbi:hypothetical protein QVD17_23661 [Tagetes erecta]|uniref:Uncharacterized protein n=1 Tax=Tagetes erecta TaxID=13708 RepID=A0AAD8KHT1_TARER|nr:hypothetical protein QVD17_23661 [Tagetes erecta]